MTIKVSTVGHKPGGSGNGPWWDVKGKPDVRNVACMRNWRAFLVYSVAILVVATLVPGLILGVLAAMLPSGAALLTVLMTVLLILVLAPTLFASFYVSYREVFVAVDEDA